MSTNHLPRSSELMSSTNTALLLIDIQEKLIPVINQRQIVLWNARRLLDSAVILDLKRFSTEQNPLRLGKTIAELSERIPSEPAEKMSFSSATCAAIIDQLQQSRISKVLLCGIETHVCVQQTALDLIGAGFEVYVAVDAVGSRYELDHHVAIHRLRESSVTITTTEAVIFEWCERADRPEFKKLSALVKEAPPAS